MINKVFKKFFFIGLLLITLSCLIQAQGLAVGKILTISGEVKLDPFGNDSFLQVVEPGEPIYKDSVIECGEDSSFDLLIMDQVYSFPQHSTVSVTDFVELETRKQNNRWFSPLVNMLQTITGYMFPQEESVDLISRGDGKTTSFNSLFSFEEEGDEDSEFLVELDILFQNNRIDESGYTASEYDYRMGFCYFQLGNYRDAAHLFDSSYNLIKEEQQLAGMEEPHYLDSLYLMEGISNYMLAEYDDAVFFFEQYLDRNQDNEYVPYASWLMSDALISMRKHDRAQIYIEKAKDYFAEHELDAEFALFLESVQ